jgi:hypothetical protein
MTWTILYLCYVLIQRLEQVLHDVLHTCGLMLCQWQMAVLCKRTSCVLMWLCASAHHDVDDYYDELW